VNKLSFKFIPEHIEKIGEEEGEDARISINDQIEIVIDGKNQFADEGFGMYPLDFFSQDKHFFNGELQIGICGCSCYQCGDTYVNVNSTNDKVKKKKKIWSKENRTYIDGNKYFFDKNGYCKIIKQFSNKYVSGELYSKAKKIVMEKVNNMETKNGYIYSMFRFYEYGDYIILYFLKEEKEEKYYIEWNRNTETLINEINKFKNENVK
jgi:hypothetical protein